MLSLGKASCNCRATQPMVHAGCFSVSIIHQTLTWTTGFLTCTQMLMHAIAHGGVWTPYEPALKADCEKNPLPHWGTECGSVTCRSDTLPQSYIPTLSHHILVPCFYDTDKLVFSPLERSFLNFCVAASCSSRVSLYSAWIISALMPPCTKPVVYMYTTPC